MASAGLVGGYGKDVVELGEDQHLFGVVSGVDEDHFATAAAELGEERNEDADAGAVDVPDFGEVDGAMGDGLAEVVVDGFEQLVGVGAADKVAGEANKQDAVIDGAGSGHAESPTPGPSPAGAGSLTGQPGKLLGGRGNVSGGGLGAAVAADAVQI